MLKTPLAIVKQGKIEIPEQLELSEGTRVLITVLPDKETEFWHQSSKASLDKVWDNTEDEVYAELLEE